MGRKKPEIPYERISGMKKKFGEKMWGGRFQERVLPEIEAFTASISFDYRLFPYDIQGSVAHCKMLQQIEILTPGEAQVLIK